MPVWTCLQPEDRCWFIHLQVVLLLPDSGPHLCVSMFSVTAGKLYILNRTIELNISACPITHFGLKYERLYLNFTSENTVFCFNGFYDPQTKGDCLMAPKGENALMAISPWNPDMKELSLPKLPTINTTMECFFVFKTTAVGITVLNYGSQAALMVEVEFGAPSVFDVLVDGNKVDTVNVSVSNGYADLSGCRSSGVLYRPGDVVSSDPATCSTVICSQTAVLQNSTSGSTERCFTS
ncbi:uncharacterized protein FYW61_019326 [Anableps anableps]